MLHQSFAVASCLFLVGLSFADEQQPSRRNVPIPLRDLKVEDDIVFKQVGALQLQLMLFQPPELKFEKSPLVVYIHGGGGGNLASHRRFLYSILGVKVGRGY